MKRHRFPRASKAQASARQLPAVNAAPLGAETNVQAVATSDLGFGGFGWGSGHQSADNSIARGYVYFPEMDTRREISSYTLGETRRKSRYLYANVGFYRRICNGIARMVAGTGLMPRPMTSDRVWNKLATARFEARWGSRAAYDLAGKFNGYTAQRAKLRCRYKDGDVATVLTKGADGRAATAIFEGHQIGNGSNVSPEQLKFLYDGIRVNKHNRAVEVRLLREDGTAVPVPAPSCLLLADYERPGQNRCLPIASHAVNHMLDKTEIDSYIKGGIKQSQRVGYYISKEPNAVPGPPRPGTGGRRETVTTSTGDKINLERAYHSAGGEVQELDPGADLKMLLDTRPHPNNIEFLEYLIRDISLGVDLTPEVLWSIVKLGGANMRYVMQDAQSFVEQEQQTLIDSDLGLEYVYFLADEIAAGNLPPCPDPEWWKHDWIPPSRWTVDIGRDGKLHLEQLRSGALTFRRFFGWQGLGVEELDEWLDEYKYIWQGAKTRGLDPQQVINTVYQRTGVATVAEEAAAAVTTAAADAADA